MRTTQPKIKIGDLVRAVGAVELRKRLYPTPEAFIRAFGATKELPQGTERLADIGVVLDTTRRRFKFNKTTYNVHFCYVRSPSGEGWTTDDYLYLAQYIPPETKNTGPRAITEHWNPEMSIDYIVNFNSRKPTGYGELQIILEDYLGCGTVNLVDGRLFAVLPGSPGHPLRRIVLDMPAIRQTQHSERWLEVFLADDHISVITRMADEFTNTLAEGFAKILARWYQGTLDLPT